MIFVDKFWSLFNCCNLTHDTPDLVFENVSLFNMNPVESRGEKITSGL